MTTQTTEVKNLYSDRASERRKQFNRIINDCDMVLMNNISEVDPSVWENSDDLLPTPCDIVDSEDMAIMSISNKASELLELINEM